MSILLVHSVSETDDRVFEPKKLRQLQRECPAMKLPGVLGHNAWRDVNKRVLYAEIELENFAALDAWEAWWATPEGDEWRQKFWETGKVNHRTILSNVE